MKLFFLILFFFGINFFLYGEYIFLTLLPISFMKSRSIYIDNKSILLIIFSIIYYLSMLIFGDENSLRIFILPIAYIIGMSYNINADDSFAEKTFLIITFGMFIHIVLNVVYESVLGSNALTSSRHYDIWSGSLSTSTAIMSNMTFLLCTCVYSIFLEKKKFIFFLFCYCLGILISIAYGSRTPLVLICVSFVVGMAYMLKNKNISSKLKLRICLVVAFLFLLLILIISKGLLGWTSFWNDSYMLRRIQLANAMGESMLSTPRWIIQSNYIKKLFEYPFGGGILRKAVGGRYAHNLFLDTYSYGGAISAILLLFYYILMVCDIIKFIKNCKIDRVKVLFVNYIFLFTIQMFLEPILQGAPLLFISSCLIHGVITRININGVNRDEHSISI